MFSRKPKQQPKSNDSDLLSKTQLDQLKQAFSDISISSKSKSVDSFDYENTESQIPQSNLIKTFARIKTAFMDMNSRAFAKYAHYCSYLHIGDQIQKRPELLKISLSVNSLELMAVLMSIFLPRKWVNKTLITLFTLTVEIQLIEKLMLNYYVQKLALSDNRMEPIQQQARNLIQYKYIIHGQNEAQKQKNQDPDIKRLLDEVTKKNIEYLRFKKVQMLL